MVEFRTELNPMRLVFGKDKKVELMLKVTNDSDKARLISADIIMSEQLSFEKNGRGSSKILRFGEMKPRESKINYFSIYPKISIQKKEQPIKISVIEHYEKKYDYILSKKSKIIYLRVE
jgi:hypothetical protein